MLYFLLRNKSDVYASSVTRKCQHFQYSFFEETSVEQFENKYVAFSQIKTHFSEFQLVLVTNGAFYLFFFTL